MEDKLLLIGVILLDIIVLAGIMWIIRIGNNSLGHGDDDGI